MKRHKVLIISLVVFAVFIISFSFYAYQTLMSPNVLVDQPEKEFLIPTGSTFDEVRDKLHEKKYVNDLLSFSVLAKLMKYDQYVKPGRYVLSSNMSNLEAIRLLRSGKQEPVNVTFNNVRLKPELAEKLTANLEADADEFLRLIQDTAIIAEYGFNEENIMTMFLPNTYEMFWTTSERELLDRMHQEYERFWNDERKSKAAALNMSPLEVSILASIVESETNKIDEAPVVAGLYLNRLERNIALQADPTLVFAAQDFTIRRVLDKHKEIDSPYNTYKYAGLPPGPIRAPSIFAIDAVLNHEDHNYLYMCAKEDFSGYHNFATNLRAHLANARRYQRALSKAGIYN
ncbi:endolytic transglycosylase MltG [Porifericola rhodea]|nr:endolytic transglycosylase MltG [Porifericola rhodea]WKN33889.1 endolytic transglycosylase MltG [Porifericola rhodea]